MKVIVFFYEFMNNTKFNNSNYYEYYYNCVTRFLIYIIDNLNTLVVDYV